LKKQTKGEAMKATIYEDPITRQKPEGKAFIIIEYGQPDNNGNVQCDVLFDGDDPRMIVSRKVYKKGMK